MPRLNVCAPPATGKIATSWFEYVIICSYVRLKSKYMSVWEGSFVVVEFCVKGARQGRSTLWHGGAGDREEDWANVKLCSDINLKRDLSPGITFHYSWNQCLNFPKARLMLVSASGDLFSLVVLSNSFNNPSLFLAEVVAKSCSFSAKADCQRQEVDLPAKIFLSEKVGGECHRISSASVVDF